MRTALIAPGHQLFPNRGVAGRRLAERLAGLRRLDPIVIGIAPGGVPVAVEVARALRAPLETISAEPASLVEADDAELLAAAAAVRDRNVVLIADLLLDEQPATAAVRMLRELGATHVTFAAPVVRIAAAMALSEWVDEILCLETLYEELPPAAIYKEGVDV